MKFNIISSVLLVSTISAYINCQPVHQGVEIIFEEPTNNLNPLVNDVIVPSSTTTNPKREIKLIKLNDNYDQAPMLVKRGHHHHLGFGRFKHHKFRPFKGGFVRMKRSRSFGRHHGHRGMFGM